ncbi:hypothetical protein BGX34_011079 [Mortierella sp. NVP85]|nr:hypothetical protein BGX34_011079 [Mortierella sp. NVP85]
MAAILGGILGFLALIVIVALLFLAARKRRRTDESTMTEEVAEAGGDGIGSSGNPSTGGDMHHGPSAPTDMPSLTPIPGPGGAARSHSNMPNLSSEAKLTIANQHKRKEPAAERVQEMSEANQELGGQSSRKPIPKRSFRATFFGGSGYNPVRRPNQGQGSQPIIPIITRGSKTELEDVEMVPRIEAGAAHRVQMESRVGQHESQEAVIHHGSNESINGTHVHVNQGEMLSGSSGTHVVSGILPVAAIGAGAIAASQHSHHSKEKLAAQTQQEPHQVPKTQITLKLSIVRYERSDAAQATPHAKPGTTMLSQVEMLAAAPEINIPGSAFSHVRDSSKATGHEANLASPVVPGPSAIASSSESGPRERSLRWMKSEYQWKREAGMLQHLKSDQYVAELFNLYALPTFAEYRFVSVMGPFTRTLESYINERQGNPTPNPTPRQAELAAQGPLTLTEKKSLTESIASALKWCHEHHVVHLNISTASIFMQEVYSEPDGHGGYRFLGYASYSNKTAHAASTTAPRIEQRWKLWNFSHARFIGEAVDLDMDMTPYTAPEILDALHCRDGKISTTTTSEIEDPNKDTTVTTTVSSDGKVTKTTKTTTKSSTTVVSSGQADTEKLMAVKSMDMWSLGQIVYEMHIAQPMFTTAKDAFIKMSGEPEHQHGDDSHQGKAHVLRIPSDVREKIERIEDRGARVAISGLLDMQPERRLDQDALRNVYLEANE